MGDGRLFRSEAVFGGSQSNLERVDDMSVSRSLTMLFNEDRSYYLGFGITKLMQCCGAR